MLTGRSQINESLIEEGEKTMRKTIQKFLAVMIVAALAVFLPFKALTSTVNAANGTEVYQVYGYDTNPCVYDSAGNPLDGYAYCLNSTRHASYYSCDYLRFRLSDRSYGTIYNLEYTSRWSGNTPTEEEETEGRRLLLNLLLKKDSVAAISSRTTQELCWDITNGKFIDRLGNITTNSANVRDLLMSEPYYDFTDYDVYYYQTQDTDYQNMLGAIFIPVATSFNIEKIVIDGLDATETYNGVDGTSGFEINLNVYDTLTNRNVGNEWFTFTATDADGNVTSQSIQTDASGNLTLTILSGQNITVGGFDSVNYRFTISEASTNMDSTCSLSTISSSNGNLTDNGDGSYSFDFSQSYAVDIDIYNRHISADPTPVPTESTTEATTAATVEATVATTEATTEETTTETAEETTASTEASVLGVARAEETTAATEAPTATPTPAPSGVVSTGESSHTPRIIVGVILVAGAATVTAVRLKRKNSED